MTKTTMTLDEAIADSAEHEFDPDYCANLFKTWLGRGDVVCVYENHDLGHRNVGEHLYLSYGGSAALIGAEQFPDGPPTTCPDIGGLIGWRYQLRAVVEPGGAS